MTTSLGNPSTAARPPSPTTKGSAAPVAPRITWKSRRCWSVGRLGVSLVKLLARVLLLPVGRFFREGARRLILAGDSGLLAGEAVYLCHRFGLPVPEWTEKPEYLSAGGLEQVLG